ncbi:MAG: hypothetical protein JWO38_4791 [Gemmataceae bacterium]|nr:hypothetical protein [Gemmataceae bacterium]
MTRTLLSPPSFPGKGVGGLGLFTMSTPLATHDFAPGALDAALEFLKRTRWDLRILRKVHVFRDRFHIIDVNGDYFEVRGVGYPDADIIPLLRAVNTAFDPQAIHTPIEHEYKEFATGRRHTWAEDRVM